MALFAGDDQGNKPAPLSEETIARFTNLPFGSAHQFLLRAIRGGTLICDGGRYRIPDPERAEFADREPKSESETFSAGSSSENDARQLAPAAAQNSVHAEGADGSSATVARVLSSAEFTDQSNALRAVLEAAGPDGIITDFAMVAPEVIREAAISGWCRRSEDHRGIERLYWRPDAAPQADAAE